MLTRDFNTRRDKILEFIVDTYIGTAEPIASRTISKKLRLGLCPASIRNVMADLEEIGFITHPHTSAGRVPTEKGYRYYIDRLMQAKLLTEEEKKQINKELKTRVKELDNLFSKCSHSLSTITRQTGIVLFSILQKSFFRHVELIRLGSRRLLIVLMTESGLTQDMLIEMDDNIDSTELLRVSNFINDQVGRGSLTKVRKEIMQRLLAERDSFFYILEKAKEIIDVLLEIARDDKLYLDGIMHIAEQPEFEDINTMKHIFRMLENEELLLSLLKKNIDQKHTSIYVGRELGDEFSECSLITSSYCIGDTACGALGVLGPKRMEYAKLVAMVQHTASMLTRVLNEG